MSAAQGAGGRARQAQIRAVLGESGYKRYQQALGRAGGIARQAQLRQVLGEDGYRAHQRELYRRAVQKYGVSKMQAILTATHEQRRCWRIANPTPAEEAVHWTLIQAGFVLHADYTATWEWSRYRADPACWPFTATDVLIEARVGPYACDLLFPAHALVIEVVGGVHALTAERDAVRCAALAAQGLTVITLTNAQVFAGAADRLFHQLLEVPHAA